MSIEVRNLNKRFGPTVVCDNLNLDIEDGGALFLTAKIDGAHTSVELDTDTVDELIEALREWRFTTEPAPAVRYEPHGWATHTPHFIIDEGGTVAVRVLGSSTERDLETRRGVRRLLTLTVPSPLKHVVGRLDNASKLALGHNPHGSVPALLADCLDAAVDWLIDRHGAHHLQLDVLSREEAHALLAESRIQRIRTVGLAMRLACSRQGRWGSSWQAGGRPPR